MQYSSFICKASDLGRILCYIPQGIPGIPWVAALLANHTMPFVDIYQNSE